MIEGVRAVPIMFAMSFVLSGVPPRPVAEAMATTDDPREVDFIISRFEQEKRTRDAMNPHHRPGDD